MGGSNPSQKVTFTSLFNDSVDGPVNGVPASTSPTGGDWGGIALRNFDDQESGRNIAFPVDGVLGVSGADDALSILNNADLSYGGGLVPKGANIGSTPVNFFRYDEITLFDARPAITNVVVSDATPPAGTTTTATGTQAGISVDLDSLRQDQLASGPLIRQVTSENNSLNGIYVRAEISGFIEQTDAEPYQDQFSNSLDPESMSLNQDGSARRNFSMFAPLPYILITPPRHRRRAAPGAGRVSGRDHDGDGAAGEPALRRPGDRRQVPEGRRP